MTHVRLLVLITLIACAAVVIAALALNGQAYEIAGFAIITAGAGAYALLYKGQRHQR
jgi:hypothetical protein